MSLCTGGDQTVITCCVFWAVAQTCTVSPGVMRRVLAGRFVFSFACIGDGVIVFGKFNSHLAVEESYGWRNTGWMNVE